MALARTLVLEVLVEHVKLSYNSPYSTKTSRSSRTRLAKPSYPPYSLVTRRSVLTSATGKGPKVLATAATHCVLTSYPVIYSFIATAVGAFAGSTVDYTDGPGPVLASQGCARFHAVRNLVLAVMTLAILSYYPTAPCPLGPKNFWHYLRRVTRFSVSPL